MGESTYQWSKRQKISANANAVCEDCGRKWTSTLTEVPVTFFIKDLDDYYKKNTSNLLEADESPMVICVFRPSDRDFSDTEITLCCVAPRQKTPYQWHIYHKHTVPGATSGCQIFPWRDKNLESTSKGRGAEQDIITVKEEIEEVEDMIDVRNSDPLVDDDVNPDVNSVSVTKHAIEIEAKDREEEENLEAMIPEVNLQVISDQEVNMEYSQAVHKGESENPHHCNDILSSTSQQISTAAVKRNNASKRKNYGNAVKAAAIEEVERGARQSFVAKKYGTSTSNISDWIKKRDKIFKAVESGRYDNSRMRSAKFPKIEKEMLKWLLDVRVPVNGPMLMERAAEFAKLIPDESEFKASNGWLCGFKRRNIAFFHP